MPEIRLEHITKRWGKFYGVDDLNLVIENNAFVTLLGPSGCGKTTTLRMIAGLEAPTSGRITIGDTVVFDSELGINIPANKRKVGFLFQNYALWPNMTVYQNISFGLSNIKEEMPKISFEAKNAARLAQIDDFILSLPQGYDTKVGAMGSRFSGGERQRIAIARALATNPKVLLCDEATSALDPNTTHSILTLIKDINRKLGITVVVITHQMSVVEEICDHVAILDGGVVVEQGEVKEIFANPKTAAAKRLVAPNGGSAARDLSSFAPDDHVVRVTFNGSSAAKPLVASLAAEKGILVSVLSADTRDLSGQCYGSMLLKLPADVEQAKQAAAYMRAQPGITVEEVTGE